VGNNRLSGWPSAPWLRTLTAYGLSQLIIALGAFARIPILVGDLGAAGYGIVVAVGGIAVVVLAIADGLAQTTRVQLVDLGQQGHLVAARIQQLANTLAVMFLAISGTAALIVLVLPKGNSSPVFAGILCVLFSSLAIFGGPSKGALEAHGRTATANLMQSATTIIGLPILVLALFISPTLEVAAFVTGLGLALPYLTSIAFSKWDSRGRGFKIQDRRFFSPLGELLKSGVARNVRHMVVWAWANSINYAFDALMVAVLVSATAAANFGLASRIMTMAMLLSLGLTPLLTTRVTQWRNLYSPYEIRRRLWKSSLLLLAASCFLVGLSLVLAGPLSKWLSHGQILPDWSLFAWLSAFAALSAISMPLMAAFSGKGGVAFRTQMAVICSVINLVVSIVATIAIGEIGPVIGSVVGLFALSVILLIHVRFRPDSILTRYAGPN
jgi:O-antigen/teichoic acid export membrane protein